MKKIIEDLQLYKRFQQSCILKLIEKIARKLMPNETMILNFLKPVYLHPYCIIQFFKFIKFTFKFQLDKNLPNVCREE